MKFSALALSAFATLTLYMPGSAAAEEVVLWHSYRAGERKALEKVVGTYNSSHDVKVKLLAVPYDAFADKISAAIPRGKGPDLFIFAQDRIGDWAASEVIEPIDFWLEEDVEEAFLPPTLDAMRYDDQIYGLPMAFKMVALIYNKKLVPTPPKTTDEMVAIGKKLTQPAAGAFGLAYENANFWYHGAWMQGFGGRVFDKKGRPTLDAAPVVASLTFAQDLAHESGIMPQEISGTLVTTLFNRGKVGMVINGPWFLGEIAKGVDYGVAPLPTISAAGKSPRPFLTAEGIIMSAKTENKKAAFEVMTYLTSPAAGIVMAKVGRQTPAHRAVYDDPTVAKDPILSVFRRQLENSIPTPNTPAMRMVWTPATTMMNKVINGKADPTSAAKPAQTEVAKLVQGARR